MPIRRIILWSNLTTFAVSSLGCSVTINRRIQLTRQELTETAARDAMLPGPIVEATFRDGEVVEFDSFGGTYSPQLGSVRGRMKDGQYFDRDATDLSYVQVKTVDQTASTIVTVLIWGAAVATVVGLIVVWFNDPDNWGDW